MNYKVRYSKEARHDLLEYTEYYFRKVSKKTAKDFYSEVKKSVSILKSNPHFQALNNNIRRIPIRKFPFLFFYTVKEENILILRFFHTSQNPKKYPKTES